MSLLKGVHHIALRPSPENFDKTVDLYKNVLGMSEVRGWGEGESRVVMLSCGDNTVMEILSTAGAVNNKPHGDMEHIALATDHVDELVEKVRNAGYKITTEPKDADITTSAGEAYPIRIAFFEGPIGESVEFFCER